MSAVLHSNLSALTLSTTAEVLRDRVPAECNPHMGPHTACCSAITLCCPHTCQTLQKFYVIKYQPGEKYNPHMDPHDNVESGPQESKRVATVVVYLNDVGSGGETLFPREGRDGERQSPSSVDTAACFGKLSGWRPSTIILSGQHLHTPQHLARLLHVRIKLETCMRKHCACSWAAADLDVYIALACGWCWSVLSCWLYGFSYPFVGAAGFCQSGVCGFTL
jgi:hypothetical protein